MNDVYIIISVVILVLIGIGLVLYFIYFKHGERKRHPPNIIQSHNLVEKFDKFHEKYKSLPLQHWETDTTILIKTFLRPQCLLELIGTIRTYYSHVRIVVVDDSEHKLFEAGENPLNIFCVHLPYYSGVSIGRNVGVSCIKTKYTIMLDDDMTLTPKSNMNILYNYLESHPNISLISAKLSDRGPFHALFERKGDVIEIHIDGYTSIDGPVTHSHRSLNCFMCKTQLLVDIPWDPNLKTNEHSEHFYRIYMAGYKVCSHSGVEIEHSHKCMGDNYVYDQFRNISNYNAYILNKHHVTRFGDIIMSEKQENFRKTLFDAVDCLQNIGIRPVVSCGTALGFHRELQFLEHDSDIDLIIFRTSITDDFAIIEAMHQFELYIKRGTLDNGLEYTFEHMVTKVHLDIFIMYEEKHFNWYGLWNVPNTGSKVTKWKLSKGQMETITLFDRVFDIEPMSHMTITYGDHWFIPKQTTYAEVMSQDYGFIYNDDDEYPDDGPVPVVSMDFVNEFFMGNVWYINLEHHKHRLANVQQELGRIDIKARRYPAIDGKTDPIIKETMDKSSTTISAGEVGCTMSHRNIWKYAVRNKVPWTLIFEDDIRIRFDIKQREFGEGMVEALAGRRNPQMVFFGACLTSKIKKITPHNKFFHIQVAEICPNCTHAYALTWRMAEVLLDATEVYNEPVDSIISYRVCKPGLMVIVDTKIDEDNDEDNDEDDNFFGGIVEQNRSTYPSSLR